MLLVALLMPTLESARWAARLTVCKGNLRQIAISHNAYAVDHRNWYPFNATQTRATAHGERWLFPAGINPTASPALLPYLGVGTSMDPRFNKILQCPQGLRNVDALTNYPHYAFYANRIFAQQGNQHAFYDTNPDGSWAATRQYVNDETLLLQKPGDTMYYRGFQNNFGWTPVNGEYTILASDLCVRNGSGGMQVITNHNLGSGYLKGSRAVWTTGNSTANYAFTDGSVRDYGFPVETFRDVMNVAAGTEGGGEFMAVLFPKAWVMQ